MPIVPWQCALGDAPAVTLPVAATVAIAPPDNSVDTNKVTISGTGTISSFGAAPLVTKDVTFLPVGGTIVLTNSLALQLLGATSRTITGQCFGRYASDGTGNWVEIGFAATASSPVAGGMSQFVLYTTSQTITIPNVTRAHVKLQGNGGGAARPVSAIVPGANGGYAEKWLSGLLVSKTLVLTIGPKGSDCTLASGTQAIPTTITCSQGRDGDTTTGAASGGDINIGGTFAAQSFSSTLAGMGYGNGSNALSSYSPGACAIEWWT